MTRTPFAVPLRPDYSADGRLWASPAPRSRRPSDYLFQAIAVDIKSYSQGRDRPILEVLKESYGEDDKIRTVMSRCITKAASIPADTTTSGWADSLVQTVIGVVSLLHSEREQKIAELISILSDRDRDSIAASCRMLGAIAVIGKQMDFVNRCHCAAALHEVGNEIECEPQLIKV